MEDSPVRKRKNRKRRVNRAGLLHATMLLLGTVVFSSCLAPQQIFTTEIDEFGWPAEREVTVEVSNNDRHTAFIKTSSSPIADRPS